MKRKLKGHASFVNGIDASKKDDGLLVSCSDDGTCKVVIQIIEHVALGRTIARVREDASPRIPGDELLFQRGHDADHHGRFGRHYPRVRDEHVHSVDHSSAAAGHGIGHPSGAGRWLLVGVNYVWRAD